MSPSFPKTIGGEPPPLRHPLEKLPQELYDYVYDLTFTANPGIRYASKQPKGASEEGRKSRASYTHPDNVGLLHVDRLSRQKFARSYYGGEGAAFVYDFVGRIILSNDCLKLWSSHIDLAHRQLIKDVRGVFAQHKIPREDWFDHAHLIDKPRRFTEIAAASFGEDAAVVLRCGTPDEVTEDLDGSLSYSVHGVELPPYPSRRVARCGFVPQYMGRGHNDGQA